MGFPDLGQVADDRPGLRKGGWKEVSNSLDDLETTASNIWPGQNSLGQHWLCVVPSVAMDVGGCSSGVWHCFPRISMSTGDWSFGFMTSLAAARMADLASHTFMASRVIYPPPSIQINGWRLSSNETTFILSLVSPIHKYTICYVMLFHYFKLHWHGISAALVYHGTSHIHAISTSALEDPIEWIVASWNYQRSMTLLAPSPNIGATSSGQTCKKSSSFTISTPKM